MPPDAPIISGGAVLLRSGLAIDADGAPRAYHPDSARGLDRLANAGEPGDWYGLACDRFGRPFVQGPSDPAPGFHVSTTALADRSRPTRDPLRYVDASIIPYASIPNELVERGVRLGDVGRASCGALDSAFVVADVGPRGKFGEGSIALARALGIPSDPRSGGVDGGVLWAFFLGSRGGWPRAFADVAARSDALWLAFGGLCAFEKVCPK